MNNREDTANFYRRFVSRHNRWIVPTLLILALTAGAGASASADFALAHWQFVKPVVLPPSLSGEGLVELLLDREVFRESNPGATDLRLVSDQGQETPYALVVQEKKLSRNPVSVRLRDLGFVPGEYSSFVADLDQSASRHSEVELDIEDQNFRRPVQVETSFDAATWAVVHDAAEIYDFTPDDQQFKARNTRVKYPESAAPYLRVKVYNRDEPPLQIEGAAVFLTEDFPARETAYRPETVATRQDAETGDTIHQLDLGAKGTPVNRLSFQTDSENFQREAGVAGSADGKDWVELGRGSIYAFDTPKFVGNSLELEFAESRFRYYRIQVADGDDAPLPLTDFTLHGVDRKLLFQPQPGKAYSLYYGNPVAVAPSYDLAQIVPYLEIADLPVAALGRQEANEAFSGLDLPLTERLPWLMPAGVALAALMVAALLYGVVRQARRVLAPPGEEPPPQPDSSV